MDRLSDSELTELENRVTAALGNGALIGNANSYLLKLIAEIKELRSPKAKSFTLHIKEMDVTRPDPTPPPEPIPLPDPTPPPEPIPLSRVPRKGKSKKN